MNTKHIALLALLTACGCSSRASQPHTASTPTPAPVCAPEASRPLPHPSIQAAVVAIETDRAHGSGFLVTGGTDKRLIVTNRHVVEGADQVAVVLDDEDTKVLGKVVKVSRKDDLALVEVPAKLIGVPGLIVSERPITVGAEVAAIGYPGVKGSESQLTYEPGTVSAVSRSFGNHAYVQTNANINPGNSGGPVINGCNEVIGVATMIHGITDRVGLLEPAQNVSRLLLEYASPQPPAEHAIRSALDDLFEAIAYRRATEADSYFTPVFLERHVKPAVLQIGAKARDALAAMHEQLEKEGKAWDELSKEERETMFAKSKVTDTDLLAFHVLLHLEKRDVSENFALREFHRSLVTDLFGDVRGHRVDRLEVEGEGAEVDLRVQNDSGTVRYRLELARHMGDWAITDLQRVR